MSLQPKTSATDQAGIVMEVIFCDAKKTIIIRSPLQVGLSYLLVYTSLQCWPIDLTVWKKNIFLKKKVYIICAESENSIEMKFLVLVKAREISIS